MSNKAKFWIIIAVMVALIAIPRLPGWIEAISEPTLSPVAEPKTGTILSGREETSGQLIKVTASRNESCVVKLKNRSGVTLLSFYVRAGQTAEVCVPSEYLYVYFACGSTWYGNQHLFGNFTAYSMDDDLMNFKTKSWEYTLIPVADGNFTETPISEAEFFA